VTLPASQTYLFSVDLEDVRLTIENGERFAPRVEPMTRRYLDWLDRHGFSATFFTVGEMARRYPDLVREIAGRGHEIACHSNMHVTIDRQSPEEFEADLAAALEAIAKCGVPKVTGYRAPTFSLTEKTQWAYGVLAKLGIEYSSSVLPAPNPLFGWPEFGGDVRRMPSGVLEIPMTLARVGPMRVPVGGGVYFRALPFQLISRAMSRAGDGVTGYFHPYDIDTESERFMHSDIHGNRFYHWLMYFNRGSVFDRLDKLVAKGHRVETYRSYAARAGALPS
jgi:polysaccharide deacetylase family protein (PEP-CTERM system associated)